jgi:hypothetical protein
VDPGGKLVLWIEEYDAYPGCNLVDPQKAFVCKFTFHGLD